MAENAPHNTSKNSQPRKKPAKLDSLEPRFAEPPGWIWDNFTSPNGGNIRYGHIKPEGEIKGTVVILPGRTEFGEKYFEAARDLMRRGYEVWTMDWKGQGGSDRHLPNTFKDHKNDYADDVADLHHFMTHVFKPSNDGPVMMSAHSMGGHIGLRYLHDHKGVFDCAAVTSPMLDIHTAPFPRSMARKLAQLAEKFGHTDKYVIGGGDNEHGKGNYSEEKVSTDPVRRMVHNYWTGKKPELALGSPTFGWLNETFKSIDIVYDEDYLKAIKTPVLLGIGMDDTVVDVPAQQRAGNILPNATTVEITGARHEIWMESNDKRNKWIKAFDDFTAKYMRPQNGPSAKSKKKPPRKRRRWGGLKPGF